MTRVDFGQQLGTLPAATLATLKRQGLPVLVTWLVTALLLLLLWWQVALQISSNERRELAVGLRDLENLTRVSQEHADRTLRSADQVIRFVRERYLALGDKLDLQQLEQSGVIDSEHVLQIGIIDAQGMYAQSSQGTPARIDLSDREHFRVHQSAGGNDSLFVSKPVLGRATGKWSIQLTRRITLTDGEFGGVVVLSIDPAYFTSFYSELQLGRGGLAALTGLDGIARARRIGEQQEFGTDLSASRLFERLRAGDLTGSYSSRSQADGVRRLIHFRRLAGYPLVIAAGMAFDDVLASHKAMSRLLLGQGALLTALLVVLAGLLSRHLSRTHEELVLRRYALRQISAHNDTLTALFSLSPDGFIGFDRSEVVKYVNPALQQLLGIEGDELIGLPARDFNRWLASRCQPEARFADTQAEEQCIVVGAARRKLLVSSRPGQEGNLSRLLYFRDVTQEAPMNAHSGDLLAAAAYELRRPMASIYGFSEVLATKPVSRPERAEFIQIIHHQAGRMAQILEDLLDLSRHDGSGTAEPVLLPLELNELVGDAISSYRCPEGRAKPGFDAGPGRLEVRADAAMLRQAFLKVLANAYEFSHEGGAVQVGFAVRRFGGHQQLGLRVVDNGIGMSPDQTRQVCDRFYRADRSSREGGTGLGMSIVKEIITLHRGVVEIDSTLGRGTAVTLWLPALPFGQTAESETLLCETA